MANSGTKYVSVNLNKSYGQNSTSFGSTRTGRPAGGGMAVLSRPRSSQKAGSKLSVPPPLNLPSLRKEHERFDSLGSGGGPAGGAGSGAGSRPSSSGMGWTKPAAAALQEKEPSFADDGPRPFDGFGRGSKAIAPAAPPVSSAVLRGEDFPSLRATLVPPAPGPGQNQKIQENSNQKPKTLAHENLSLEQKKGKDKDADADGVAVGDASSLVNVNSRFNVPRTGSFLGENGRETRGFIGSLGGNQSQGRANQDEYFPGPLPLVRLNPRSDWADDERDTGHGFLERSREGRDHGFPKSDAFWDFDMPRVGVLPQKHGGSGFEKRGQLRGNEAGKVSSSEVPKVDPYDRLPGREENSNSWRNSSSSKDGFGLKDAGNERNGVVGARPSSGNRDVVKDNKYSSSPFRDVANDDSGKRDVGYGQGGKQAWNNVMQSYGERNGLRDHRHVGGDQHNRNRVDSAQSSVSKSSFSMGGKGLSVNDPLLNFGREKRTLPKSEKAYLEDFGASAFDGSDLFSGGLVGVVKKKKDVLKQTDFHDPVRESFEAELERVQRMQEQERQRIVEEQERVLELARREEEERLRLAREQEERQRRLEEEAREEAWRAEQERIEALRKAEEQRLAREEEKQRIILEEERRKQAAKQKLVELEQRIAMRQAEAAKGKNNAAIVVDEKMPGIVNEKDASRATDVGDWEDSERMVDRILTSASSDSSSVNRPLEMGSRSHFSRDLSSTFVDRGKPVNSWRRDAYESWSSPAFYPQDQENSHNSPRRDSSIGGKPFMRKEYNGGGAGIISSRTYYKGGISEPNLDEYAHVKAHRWNQPADGDHLGRNTEIDSDFHENFVERFGDGWTQNRPRGNPFPAFPDRPYQNSESDGPYALGRSRYSVRQPRVLPPPSIASVHRTYRNGNEHPGPSALLENEIPYNQATLSNSTLPTTYDNGNHGQPEIVNTLQEAAENEDHKVENTPRCDSQSSLSVSSPPSSPTHLSHDDLDDSGDSPVILTSEENNNGPVSAPDNESITTPATTGNENAVASCTVSSGDDDEWTTENNEQFQEQEEYDEDEEYREEDEVHEGDDNADLHQDFENMHLQDKGLPHLMDNLVLGFDEGVQVGLPNEEFERTSKHEETTYMVQQASNITLEVPFDNDGKALQPVDDTSQANLNSSSSVFQESEKPTPDLVIQPSNAHSSVASESLGNVEASNGLSANHSTSSSVTIASQYTSSGQIVPSNVAAGPSQAELPIKLQFGLFSGPSLIPSPVPAIQIGSIQMPLHLHPQVGAPLSHMHPSQPPLFQFGQLRYTSPVSQGILPLGPQSMSFVQPNIPSGFPFNHNSGSQMPVQTGPETSDSFIKKEIGHHSVLGQPDNSRNLSQASLTSENAENMAGRKQGQVHAPHDANNRTRTATSFRLDKQGSQNVVAKRSNTLSNAKESDVQPHTKDGSLHSVSEERDLMESKGQFPVSGVRGKRYVYTVKTSSSKSSAPAPRDNRADSRGFMRRPNRNTHRTEFRVRESADKRQPSRSVLTDQFGLDNKSNVTGRGTGISGRTGPRKSFTNKLGKQTAESVGENSYGMDSGSRAEMVEGKESTKAQSVSHSGQSSLKRNLCSEEDVDAPLQSGIIRVFQQPGIEAPSDEDDFIEVRSKRQMINDRREQREKENKAKSRVAKVPRKTRSTARSTVTIANSSRGSISTGQVSNSSGADFVAAEVHGMAKSDASSGYNSNLLSQALPPIGTPPLKIDAQPDLRSQTNRSLHTSLPSVSGGEKDPGSVVIFEGKNKVLDNVQASLGSWGNVQISQQVMSLTQTQLDEAMKPQQFDSQASVGNMTGAVNESSLPTSSILTKEKAFSSAVSPINSLLAGEKIQFGAVTSPTVLPPSSRAVSHGIGPPRSSRSDMQISHNLAGSDNDCSLFFDKEKHGNKPHGHLEDCDAEAEAEAAASAVAVAAIGSDEIVGNGLGTCSVSVSDAKNFVAADIDRVVAGVGCEQQSASHSRSEESLSVSLPADLSVETTPISFWPPLPNTQNSSGQMISHFPSVPPHFPSGPPSHFPFYEMNPMMGGPVFAFGPHDESASTTQSQPQKTTAPASRSIGNWQQCHSGVESFYGPPTGFTGPFIAPPGGIPGVQGPPHMVVYNHFAPVGQFGQVGLSFMGTTYIPSGKQPDWKHIPPTSAAGTGEGDMNNMNMASSQRNPANMPSQIQHLAPGSPLLPMASPVAMFDVSPFQPSTEMSVQARWPHVPNAPLSSIPLSMSSHQQEGVQTSQLSHGPSVDQPLNVKRFTGSRTSTSSDSDRNFHRAADVNVNQLPDELGLVDTSNSTVAKTSARGVVNKTPSVTDATKVDVQNGNSSNSNNQNASSAYKTQTSQHSNVSTQQYDHSSGHANYQRGGVSQRNSSGGEWSHRRYQGRNQSLGADKSFSSSKVKQIYVAKQTISGASPVS